MDNKNHKMALLATIRAVLLCYLKPRLVPASNTGTIFVNSITYALDKLTEFLDRENNNDSELNSLNDSLKESLTQTRELQNKYISPKYSLILEIHRTIDSFIKDHIENKDFNFINIVAKTGFTDRFYFGFIDLNFLIELLDKYEKAYNTSYVNK
ncbi:MAG: hypothetical protein LBS76_00935 [Mycoplasmataceae bacterium]|nr:hypothetical protein [Mycoplasmataceae bacterium]